MKSELPTKKEAEIAYWSFEYYTEGAGFTAKQVLQAYATGELIPAARTCHRCGQILSDKKSSPVDLRGGERHG